MCCNVIPRRLLLTIAALGVLIGLGQFTMTTDAHTGDAQSHKDADHDGVQVPAVLNYDVKDIEGNDTHLTQYYGEVVLIVNTASKCGLTPQYKQLQAMHDAHHDAGLSIIGFPANNFGKQEPGSDEQIIEFCEKNYGVTFDMYSKISVKGRDQAPLYSFLTSERTNPKFAGEIRWNFDKFLVSREGKVIARFEPRTKPDSKEVVDAIKAALKQPVPEDVEAVRASHKPKATEEANDEKE